MFVSYAQNFEDVMLWRALQSVEAGFYVDVGACWPEEDSVTKAFYDRGWRGINIEPNPDIFAKLNEARPGDTNLDVAITLSPGTLTFYKVPDTGLSTLDQHIAEGHAQAGWEIETLGVATLPLRDVLARHVPEGQAIHFLKIDVEGLELAALQSSDWDRFRPWIVLVEATQPSTTQESHFEWEPILADKGYSFAYADGLNRFYIASEHSHLKQHFRYPPNVFDQFKLKSESNALERARIAEEQAQISEERGLRAEQVAEERRVHAEQIADGRRIRAEQIAEKAFRDLEEVNSILPHFRFLSRLLKKARKLRRKWKESRFRKVLRPKEKPTVLEPIGLSPQAQRVLKDLRAASKKLPKD